MLLFIFMMLADYVITRTTDEIAVLIQARQLRISAPNTLSTPDFSLYGRSAFPSFRAGATLYALNENRAIAPGGKIRNDMPLSPCKNRKWRPYNDATQMDIDSSVISKSLCCMHGYKWLAKLPTIGVGIENPDDPLSSVSRVRVGLPACNLAVTLDDITDAEHDKSAMIEWRMDW